MKPALIFGLALAANALTADHGDNEQFVAPTGSLADFAKKHPHIMFDEQADDELLVRPISTHVADDELIVAPTDEFGRIKHYPPYIRYEAEDHEFFPPPTHKMNHLTGRVMIDDEVDHENFSMAGLFGKSKKQKQKKQQQQEQQPVPAPTQETTTVFEQADDELLLSSADMIRRFAGPPYIKYDELADNEQFVAPTGSLADFAKKHPYIMFDESADNEQFVAPTGSLADFAKKHPHIMFDEQADDENFSMAGLFGKSKKQKQKKQQQQEQQEQQPVPVPTQETTTVFEQADDELLVRPLTTNAADDDEFCQTLAQFQEREKAYQEYRKLKLNKLDDQADDELIAHIPENLKHHRIFSIISKIAADDEFIVRPIVPLVAADDELLMRPVSKNVPIEHLYVDDELLMRPVSKNVPIEHLYVDDELIIAPTDEFGRIKQYPPYIRFDEDGNEFFVAPTHRLGEHGNRFPGKIMYDEQADDELATYTFEDLKQLLERQLSYRARLDDAQADDELMMGPLDGTGKYNRRAFDDVKGRMMYDDQADDELLVRPISIHGHSEALLRDDAGDDELAQLGHLIRHAQHDYSLDDEFRAEKFPHLKTQIKNHYQDHELPEIRGKYKPMSEGGFLGKN